MPPSIRGICFDLFNTLVNVGQVPPAVGGVTADILGVDRARWREACFGDQHEIRRPSNAYDNLRRMARALDPTLPEARIRTAVEHRQRRFDHALRHVPPSVLSVLRTLREAGHRLALVSNASTAEVRAWPDSPLAPLFDAVVFSCECGAAKPEPAIYRRALARLELDAAACLFVGDGGSEEHRGAHALGLHPLWLTEHVAPDRQARLAAELAPWIRGRIARLTDLPAWLTAYAGERTG